MSFFRDQVNVGSKACEKFYRRYKVDLGVSYASHSGLALAGLCLNRYSNLSRVTGRKMENKGNLISNIDILRSYLGLLCLG